MIMKWKDKLESTSKVRVGVWGGRPTKFFNDDPRHYYYQSLDPSVL